MSVSPVALARRVFAEHRTLTLLLLGLIGANMVIAVLVVPPLAARVANVTERDTAAEEALASAQQSYAEAAGLLTAGDRTETELDRFYGEILPQGLAGARRLTQSRLVQMAQSAGLTYERTAVEPVSRGEDTLARLAVQLQLSGRYEAVRRFLYELDTAPAFVVVENVAVGGQGNESGTLTVEIELSTYFRNEESL